MEMQLRANVKALEALYQREKELSAEIEALNADKALKEQFTAINATPSGPITLTFPSVRYLKAMVFFDDLGRPCSLVEGGGDRLNGTWIIKEDGLGVYPVKQWADYGPTKPAPTRALRENEAKITAVAQSGYVNQRYYCACDILNQHPAAVYSWTYSSGGQIVFTLSKMFSKFAFSAHSAGTFSYKIGQTLIKEEAFNNSLYKQQEFILGFFNTQGEKDLALKLLTDTLSSKTSELSEVKAQITEILEQSKQELANSAQILEVKRQELGIIIKELEEKRQEIERLEQENADPIAQKQELENNIISAKEEEKELNEKLEYLKEQTKDLDALKEELENLKEQIKAKLQEKASLEQASTDLQNQKIELEVNLSNLVGKGLITVSKNI